MCTAVSFIDDMNNLYFGRNLDWSCGYGEKIIITPKQYNKMKSPFNAILKTKYPIIGMGIIEEDTPLYFDCGNDQGLAIAGLNFPGYAQYEENVIENLTNVSAYEFPLWVAGKFATVAEVRKALKNVAIINKPINEKYPCSLLHWIISDAVQSIIVEYTNTGMHVYDNSVSVLANQPEFPWHKENLRNYINLHSDVPDSAEWNKLTLTPYGSGAGMRGLPGDYYSPSRFVRAAYLNANYPIKNTENDNVNKMFHILKSVAMIDGAAKMTNGDFEKTIYTSCFSSFTKVYYFMTYDDLNIQRVKLKDIDSIDLIEY